MPSDLTLIVILLADTKDHDDIDVDLNRDFLHDLRDVKVLADKELLDEHKL